MILTCNKNTGCWRNSFTVKRENLHIIDISTTTYLTCQCSLWRPSKVSDWLFVLHATVFTNHKFSQSNPYITKLEGGASNLRLINDCFTNISSQIFPIYIHIFHKIEVQTVILRWLLGLNLDWFKNLRCSLRLHASSANSQRIAT